MKQITGTGAATGFGIGKVALKKVETVEVIKRDIEEAEISLEVEKFEQAKEAYDKSLIALEEKTKKEIDEESAKIFTMYRSILQDQVFFDGVLKMVKNQKVNIDYAIEAEKVKTCEMMRAIEDQYMRERAIDIENVCNELIAMINGKNSDNAINISNTDIIVIADDLTPADTVKLDKKYLKGFITEKGGLTSHTVILAKTLGIPAIVGAEGAGSMAEDGQMLVMDGDKGVALVDPDEKTVQEYIEKKKDRDLLRSRYEENIGGEAATRDGFKIKVDVNSGDADSIQSFDKNRCDGIGLFRTEFLYMNHSDYPTEEEQFTIYKDIVEKAGGKEVVIRTLDIGGDKQLGYMDLPKEDNPFLGYRAIRICLDREEMFLTQLRAILRSSAFGYVKIMFPMIVNIDELRKAKDMVEKAKTQLKEKGIAFDNKVETGIMVETPAAVLLSDQLSKEADFFSIGSNDLIQYVTASDRMNDRVQYLYESCNLSVLRAIAQTAKNAKASGISVGICGEAASEERLLPLWVALGIDKLSMVPSQVGRIKYLIRKVSKADMEKKVLSVLDADNSKEVAATLEKVLSEIDG